MDGLNDKGYGDNMQPEKELKRFKKEPKYPHYRSEGMTHRRNSGTKLQVKNEKET